MGFEVLGWAAAGLAAVGFKKHQVHCPDAAEPSSVTETVECNDAKPNVGKAGVCLVPFLADAIIYQF